MSSLGKIFLAVTLLSLVGVSVFFIWTTNLPLISPIALIENIYSPETTNKKVVYGFLPYWNFKYKDQLQISHLTHLAYFAVDLNEDGSINKKVNKQETEPGWNKLNSKDAESILYQSKLLKQKTVITITAMEPDLIESIVNNPKNSSNAIDSTLSVYRQFNFDGINIDFEYVGEPSQSTIDNFTNFIKTLNERCRQVSPECFIDIDIFGDTASKKRLWDLEKLHPHVTNIIVMAYDYYRKSSTQAGPIAPITGSCKSSKQPNCLEHDILEHLSLISKKVPTQKIILGVPFYGYEWQTASEDFLANTYPKTGSLATYQRIQSLPNNPKVSSISAKWSSSTLSPYLTYYEDGNIYQIQYEDANSLKLKTDIVKSANLGGIGIWALGYEVPYQDLWTSLSQINK